MPSPSLAVVCAWCNRVVTPAPPGASITHTICPSCMEWAIIHRTAAMRPEPSDRRRLPDVCRTSNSRCSTTDIID